MSYDYSPWPDILAPRIDEQRRRLD